MRALSGLENRNIYCHTTNIDDVGISHTPQSIKITDILDQIPEFSFTESEIGIHLEYLYERLGNN